MPAELLYVCYASVQFSAYRSVSVLLRNAPVPWRLPDAAESFVSGASAGILATTVTYPLDLLRTRFAAQGRRKVYSSLWGAVREIKRDEGLRGFFRGVGPGLAGIAPYMGIFFATYEWLRLVVGGWNMPWGSGEATAGVAASVVAKTAVFPLDLVRKRIQIQGPTRAMYAHGQMPEYSSALHALRSVVRMEGFRGLFKGLPISLIKAAPGSAITVWTYERTLHFVMNLEKGKEDVTI